MSACGKCNKVVTSSTKTKLQCAICHVYYHATCANIKESDVDTSSKKPYYCDVCVKKIRLQRSASDSTPVKTDEHSEQLITSDACSVKVFKEMLEQLENKILNGQRRLEDDLGAIEAKAASILKMIEKTGKMNPVLEQCILGARSFTELEHISVVRYCTTRTLNAQAKKRLQDTVVIINQGEHPHQAHPLKTPNSPEQDRKRRNVRRKHKVKIT
ncbi:hypothetical protein LSTR_LSTR009794 [Laodelphax striatellus]|uniref:Phorbol-ester/DAG-type domain-containing protein n=1 Tax=Laodelphax striatellus TaxID=195883 RepID=A0A482XN62_LAOST|nr:hypothetical protein LSTR_LSTR009794 [Laodelphax striatellus]